MSIQTLTSNGNGNGKKWWQEVWGKVVAGLILLTTSALVVWTWGKAQDAAAATMELYALPAVVQSHEQRIKQIEARPEMTQKQVETLAEQIAAAMAKKKGK